jgi:hypothetical protein
MSLLTTLRSGASPLSLLLQAGAAAPPPLVQPAPVITAPNALQPTAWGWVVLDGDVLTGVMDAPAAGTLAVTLSDDALSATGDVDPVTASETIVESDDTVNAIEVDNIVATLAVTLANDVLVASVGEVAIATATIVEADDTLAAGVSVPVTAAIGAGGWIPQQQPQRTDRRSRRRVPVRASASVQLAGDALTATTRIDLISEEEFLILLLAA